MDIPDYPSRKSEYFLYITKDNDSKFYKNKGLAMMIISLEKI